jgi:hypothetical protein
MAALGMSLNACGGAEEEQEPVGYVLLDLEAQEAGWRLDGVAERGLPQAFFADESVDLVGPEGVELLEPEPGELYYVRGTEGAVERYGIGDEIDADSVFVIGTGDAAKQLGKLTGADAAPVQEGVWRLWGLGSLSALSGVIAPAGLEEIVPAEAADGLEEEPSPGMSPYAAAENATAWRGAFSGKPFDFRAATRIPVGQLMSRKVQCADPVEGIWVSRRFDPTILDWHLFTMEVRRDPQDPSVLHGRIRTRNWSGGSESLAPVACSEMDRASYGHRFDLTVDMVAEGSFDGDTFSFQGTNWHETARSCGPYGQWYSYHLDHFTGSITEDGKTIDAVNNDGARAFDEAHTLQRVGCL